MASNPDWSFGISYHLVQMLIYLLPNIPKRIMKTSVNTPAIIMFQSTIYVCKSIHYVFRSSERKHNRIVSFRQKALSVSTVKRNDSMKMKFLETIIRCWIIQISGARRMS